MSAEPTSLSRVPKGAGYRPGGKDLDARMPAKPAEIALGPPEAPRRRLRAPQSPGTGRSRSVCRLIEHSMGEDRLQRVRLGGGLVLAIADDPGEAQRDAARIARGGLDAVERDLDHQLGPHVDHVALA